MISLITTHTYNSEQMIDSFFFGIDYEFTTDDETGFFGMKYPRRKSTIDREVGLEPEQTNNTHIQHNTHIGHLKSNIKSYGVGFRSQSPPISGEFCETLEMLLMVLFNSRPMCSFL